MSAEATPGPILVVDNYDSFVYNLVQYLRQLGAQVLVRRNDHITAGEAETLGLAGVLLSPGPGAPAQAGVCAELVEMAAGQLPLLGVCLGHQVIAEVFGGIVERAEQLMHGRTSQVIHTGRGVCAGLPNPLTATRYHSLAVREEGLPSELEVTARTDDGVIMALRHKTFAIEGVQFHPESVLTVGGHRLLANWLGDCGIAVAPALVDELQTQQVRTAALAAVRT